METTNKDTIEITNGISPQDIGSSKNTDACYTKEINENAERKQQFLSHIFHKNIHGSDFLLCIFFAALQSCRADECLRPFPGMYVENGQKDFHKLRKVCDTILSVKDMLESTCKLHCDVLSILMWLFTEPGLPILRKIQFQNLSIPGKISKSLTPDYVFEVHHPPKVQHTWQKRKEHKETFLAYHGSRIENFYSILKIGLQQHFSSQKVVLFGDGIYLTSEITVSANYAPFGQSWKNSIFGSKHSIIAVCEVINNVEKVKCKDVKNKQRAVVQGAFGTIPEKYYVVTDSDMVQVKYLLVYKEKAPVIKSFIFKHISVILIALYVLMLLMIGFFNTPTWKRLWYNLQKL